MRTSIILIVLAVLSGCASVDIKRKVYDASNREIRVVDVHHPLTTAEGAASLMEQARLLQAMEQDGNAERRTSEIASKSVDKDKPTSVSTRGGQVQSGFGYGGYGPRYDPYGYGYGASGYGQPGYGSTVYYPGADPNTVRIEAWSRQGMYQTLPPLGEPITPPYPTSGVGAVPGTDPRIDKLRQDTDEILRIHRKKK